MKSQTFPHKEPDAKSANSADVGRALDRALAFVKDNAQNGWWSYVAGGGPSTEATAWCALALHAAEKNDVRSKKTVTYLLNKQNRDGGWSTAPVVEKSDWSTAPAVLALRLLNDEKPLDERDRIENSVLKGSNYLFDLRTDPYRSVARFMLFLMHGEESLHYARGWPWNKDCSYWVEPTSYSLLALKLPNVPDRSIISAALRHATIYLHDHACQGGGWNHGANITLDVWLPAFVVTTAEALVALQNEPHSKIIEDALDLIQGDRQDSHSSLALSWTILALHVHGKNLGTKPVELLSHQNADGSFGLNNVTTSLAILALLTAYRNCNLLMMRK